MYMKLNFVPHIATTDPESKIPVDGMPRSSIAIDGGSKKASLGPGAVAGIVIGTFVAVGLLSIVLFKLYSNCFRTDNKKQKVKESSQVNRPSSRHRNITSCISASNRNSILPTSIDKIALDMEAMEVAEKKKSHLITIDSLFSWNKRHSSQRHSSNNALTYDSSTPIIPNNNNNNNNNSNNSIAKRDNSNRFSFRPISLSQFMRPTSRTLEEIFNDTFLHKSPSLASRLSGRSHKHKSFSAIQEPDPLYHSPLQLKRADTDISHTILCDDGTVPIVIEQHYEDSDSQSSSDSCAASFSSADGNESEGEHQVQNKLLPEDNTQKQKPFVSHRVEALRGSTATEIAGNKSVDSVQFVGFNSAMDTNYVKRHSLGVKNFGSY